MLKRIGLVVLLLSAALSAQRVGVIGRSVPRGGGLGMGGGLLPPSIPSAPSPQTDGYEFTSSPTVSCGGGGGATGWTIYGPDTTNPPTTAHSRSDCSFSTSGLSDGTAYYWQAVATNASGTTPGPVWTFNNIRMYPWAGFSTATRGAYSGSANPAIYRVSNLNDSGTGSLRAALLATEPRVVVFETSGTIVLESAITIVSPYLTVAGQTAPSPGITIRASGAAYTTIEMVTGGHDVIWQHVRIRPGAGCNSSIGAWHYSGVGPYNLVFDHLSASWGQDENMYLFRDNGSGPIAATVYRSILSEGLFLQPGSSGCTGGGASNGHGLLIYRFTYGVTVVQNLFAHNRERNPYAQTDTRSVVLNNVIYNWFKEWGIVLADNNTGDSTSPWYLSAVGNRFIRGPNTTTDGSAELFTYLVNGSAGNSGNQIYRSDNTLTNDNGLIADEVNQLVYNPNVGAAPSQAPLPGGYTPLASTATEAFVLANAGARPLDRDAVDTRVVASVTARNGAIISSPSAVGGYPTLAQNPRTYTTPTNPNTVQASGYTNLEQDLAIFAYGVEHNATLAGGGGGGGGTASNSGTRVPTNASSIIDNSGDTWSLGTGVSPTIQILLNGALQTVGGGGVYGSQILWLSNTLYVKGDDNNWYLWNGSTYSFLGATDPEG